MMRGDRKGVDRRGKGGEEGEWMGRNWNEVGDWEGRRGEMKVQITQGYETKIV